MAYATQPNVTLSSAWTPVSDGSSEVTIQIIGGGPVIVFIGAAAPSASSLDGHRVSDATTLSGLTTEKVYARAVSNDRPATVAVTKG